MGVVVLRASAFPVLALVICTAGFCLNTADASPIITPDLQHPGYYQPFRCLQYDPDSQTHGFLRNRCGHAVEAAWQSARGSWGSWTLKAGESYPIFDGFSGAPFGCLPNGHFNHSLELCKDDRAGATVERKSPAGDLSARDLAKQLGVTTPGESAPTGGGSALDARSLAEQLGVGTSTSAPGDYTASQLQADLNKWDDQERTRIAAEERERRSAAERKRRWEEQQRIEMAKREQILREQQLLAREQAEEEQQQNTTSDNSSSTDSGLLGSLLQGAATVYMEHQIQNSTSYTPSSSAASNVNCNLSENRNNGACMNICNLPGHANDAACVRLRGGVPADSGSPGNGSSSKCHETQYSRCAAK